MKRHLIIVSLFSLAFAPFSCRRSSFPDSFSARDRRVLENPSQVELFEVVNKFDLSESQYVAMRKQRSLIAGYPIVKAVRTDPEFGRQLGKTLLDSAIYHPDGQVWMCLFEPHHVGVFSAGKERVTAVMCFKCGDIEIHAGTDTEKSYPMQSLSPSGNKRVHELVTRRFSP